MKKRSFETVYKEKAPRLKLFLKQGWSLREEDIEEIIQDVMYTLYEKSSSPFFSWNSSWVFKVTGNRAIDFLRSNRAREVQTPCWEDYPAENLNPLQQLLLSDQRLWIREFLFRLEPLDRRIAHLYYFEEMGCRKIGCITDTPYGTVKYRLYRIRQKLKEEWSVHEEKQS